LEVLPPDPRLLEKAQEEKKEWFYRITQAKCVQRAYHEGL
jgi:hypothetical protein